jgi:DNA-binding NarL/FixJ family response regulator
MATLLKTESPAGKSSEGTTALRLLLVDDHPGFLRGLHAILDEEPHLQVCGEAGDARSALDAMRRLKPGYAIVDICLPGCNGIELIKLMLAEMPKLRILVLSMHDESIYALRALRAGAKGYLMKTEALESVLVAIRKIEGGGIFVSTALSDRLIFKAIQSEDPEGDSIVSALSDRELEVLALMGKGLGTREVAEKLGLSVKTIETHRAHMKEKLHFAEGAELVRFAMEWSAQQRDGEEKAGES